MNDKNLKKLVEAVLSMASDSIKNYIIPGLTSSLLNNGSVRLFECSREHRENVAPHNHRFDLTCFVLKGSVKNTIWREKSFGENDYFMVSKLSYQDEVGKYKKFNQGEAMFEPVTTEYETGDVYFMTHDLIHSIKFSRDSKVLIFEGPTVSKSSLILEPYVNGEVVPTGDVQPWMFNKGE